MSLKIVADDKIPFLKGVLEPFADITYMPGNGIGPEHLKDADALLIRTRTHCDEKLLRHTRVKFIGTATIGFDHIDTGYCERMNIAWTNAPGCNAGSVNQYIASTLAFLSRKFHFDLKDRVLGVVGVGHVGTKVVHSAEMLGMRVYLCDPPRVKNDGVCGFISLEGILRECDLITFHVPLNLDGPDRTLGLINNDLLNRMNPGTIIINTSRGEIADGKALLSALDDGRIAGVVLDVWENEPDIDLKLLNRCIIGTPHIAGYSADGKARGTAMIVQALSRYFDLGLDDWEPAEIPAPEESSIRLDCSGLSHEEILLRAVEFTYRVEADHKKLIESPQSFEKQRGDYPFRREFKAYTVCPENGDDEISRICKRMGFYGS